MPYTLNPFTGNFDFYMPPASVDAGVNSIAASGEIPLEGDVTLSGGTYITLNQVGQNIQINAAPPPSGDAVNSLNGLTGNVVLSASGAATINEVAPSSIVIYAAPSGTAVNEISASGESPLTGSVTLSEGTYITLTQSGNNIEISANPPASGSAVNSLNGLTGTVTLAASGATQIGVSGQNINIYSPPASAIDHNSLANLTVGDPHTQYAFLAGRSGGQTLIGGTGTTDVIRIRGTSGNGTAASAAIVLQVGNNGSTDAVTVLNNGNVGIGLSDPNVKLVVNGEASIRSYVTMSAGLTTSGIFGPGSQFSGAANQFAIQGQTDILFYTNGNGTTIRAKLDTGGIFSAYSFLALGTAGAGYLEIPNQSSAPSTPTSASRIYIDSSNRLSWKGTNGFVRTFDGTANTADRSYTLPNASGTLVLSASPVFSGMPDVQNTVTADGSSPSTFRISGLLNSNAWTVGASVANLDFYNSDAGGGGAGVRVQQSAITEDTLGNNWAWLLKTSSANATPSERLRVGSTGIITGTSTDNAQLRLTSSSTTATGILLTNTSTGGGSWAMFNVGSAAGLAAVDSLVLRETNLNVTAVTITAGPRMGIGVTTPGQSLEVADTGLFRGGSSDGTWTAEGQIGIKEPGGNPYISWHADGGARNGFIQSRTGLDFRIFNDENTPMLFYTNGTFRMTLEETGFLGIGLTGPDDKLHVANGNIRVTGGDIKSGGDDGGVATFITLTNASNTSANSTGVGTILMKGATNRNSTGFIKMYNGTTAIWIPYFTTITG